MSEVIYEDIKKKITKEANLDYVFDCIKNIEEASNSTHIKILCVCLRLIMCKTKDLQYDVHVLDAP